MIALFEVVVGRHLKLLTCFPLTESLIDRIQAAVPDWELVHSDQNSVAGEILDCDVFCGHAKQRQIDWAAVVRHGRLKWIQSSAAGLDHCLTLPVIDSNIVVTGCTGLFRDSVAEQTMALLYGLIRSLPVFFRAGQRKEFIRRPTDDLHGKTIGIVGFGGNGQRIAEMLYPLGNEMIATDRFVDEWKTAVNLPPVGKLMPASQLDELLSRSDIVILTLPLDSSTECIMGSRQFQLMPEGAYFINVGRGRLVDESALIDSLQRGHLRGAGLDVTFEEPLPAGSPLWTEPNVIISPHVGAQSATRYDRVVELLIENLGRFMKGGRLKNLVDKQVGFPMPGDRL